MWICPQPFRYIYPSFYGWEPCCKINGQHFPRETKPIIDWWTNDENLNTLRRDMISGRLSDFTRKACKECVRREESGGVSYRQHVAHALDKHTMDSILEFADTGKMELRHRNLIYKFLIGNQCNLSCYMCDPLNSTTRRKEVLELNDDRYFKVFEMQDMSRLDDMIKVAPYIDSLAIAGGEPLYSKVLYEALDKLIEIGEAKNIYIHINTNLTILKSFLKKYKDEFNGIGLSVSIDDLFDRNDWLRYGSKFKEILKNLKLLKETNIDHIIMPSWSILNVVHAEEIFNFFERIQPNLNIVEQPEFLDVKNLPDKVKDKLINDFEKSKNSSIIELINYIKNDRVEEEWRKGLDYCDALDKNRGTNFREIFKNKYTDFTYEEK